MARVLGLHHRRLHEPTPAVLSVPADQDPDAVVGPDPLQDLTETGSGPFCKALAEL
jgi:hypothetical protein